MKAIRAGLLLACAGVLVGCGGAPSEGDMRAAVEKQIETDNANLKSMTGGKHSTKLHDFKKIGCKEDGEKAYKCDVEMDVEVPMMGRNKATAPMRFVKGSDGWVIAQ